nr:CRISPR-associated protein Csx11 [Bacillota bacterium]
MSDLEKLSEDKEKESILLAEIGALLHDMGKCVDAHIEKKAFDCSQGFRYNYRKLEDIRREAGMPNLLSPAPRLQILGEQVTIDQFVERSGFQWLIKTLKRCHGAAHIEKEETDETGKQSRQDTRLSSPFGIEGDHVSGLTALLKRLPWSDLQQREKFLPALREAFEQALGETRRPENEVTLWDWSLIVAALYKAALAGALLGYKPDPNELRWRLLSVRFDGLGFLSEAHRIPDLLGRKEALENALDKVKELLEVEYPLGTEIYRDENGSIYVVPGCQDENLQNLLDLKDENGHTLRELIREQFKRGLMKEQSEEPKEPIAGEIIPEIEVDEKPWWAQDPRWKTRQPGPRDEPPPIGDHLRTVATVPDLDALSESWQSLSKPEEVCTVCG